MSKRDYYEVLGVSKTADADTIKKSYRKLAMKFHPDSNKGDPSAEEKFKEINEAYEILKDSEKRAAYDRYGHAGPGNSNAAGFDFSGFDFNTSGFAGFGDIFGDFFGGAGGNRAGQRKRSRAANVGVRGEDLQYNLKISLLDVLNGKKQSIRFKTFVSCSECDGSGSKAKDKGNKYTDCKTCHGVGSTTSQQGFFTVERTCAKCHGSGKIIANPCGKCHGDGRVNDYREIDVNIPVGIESGNRIRVPKQGEAGLRGGAAGDLHILVSIQHHKFFTRDGQDLKCTVPLKMTTAALGGALEVPDLDGNMTSVQIRPGTQSGTLLRLKGIGLPALHKPEDRGDIIMKVKIEIPINLTEQQKELLIEFEKLSNQDAHPESEGFFGKIKSMWNDFTT